MRINNHVCEAYINLGKPNILYEGLDDYKFYIEPNETRDYFIYYEKDIINSNCYRDISILQILKTYINVINSEYTYPSNNIRMTFEIDGIIFNQENKLYTINYTTRNLCYCVFETSNNKKQLLYVNY